MTPSKSSTLRKASLFYLVFVMFSYTTGGPFGLEVRMDCVGPAQAVDESNLDGLRRGNGLKSIGLAFVRAHVAAGRFRSPGTPLAALVGLQKVAREVKAAGGIAGVKRRAA
jgi:hypothetical protein